MQTDQIVVNGGKKLFGDVEVSGSKNASLPILVASILTDEPSIIENVPDLKDVSTICEVLKTLGARVTFRDGHVVEIDPSDINSDEAPYELVKRMRASIYVLGALLARRGKAKVSLPGGCAIGFRPIDLHLKGLEKLGTRFCLEHGYIYGEAKKLKGKEIYLDIPSLGATVNLLLAAVLSEGETQIKNAARDPEIVDLTNFLKKMGAQISGEGSDQINIVGVKKLKGVNYRVIPDRIEASTYLIAGIITGGRIKIQKCFPKELTAIIDKTEAMGAKLDCGEDYIQVHETDKLSPVEIITRPYPGFPTDMQAQMMALLTVTPGTSVVTESVWKNRFMHVEELERMGARIYQKSASAIIEGVEKLSGAQVMATDLRASVALIIAGLVAEGKTVVSRVYHLDRGYEKLVDKLKRLGADIERISK